MQTTYRPCGTFCITSLWGRKKLNLKFCKPPMFSCSRLAEVTAMSWLVSEHRLVISQPRKTWRQANSININMIVVLERQLPSWAFHLSLAWHTNWEGWRKASDEKPSTYGSRPPLPPHLLFVVAQTMTGQYRCSVDSIQTPPHPWLHCALWLNATAEASIIPKRRGGVVGGRWERGTGRGGISRGGCYKQQG